MNIGRIISIVCSIIVGLVSYVGLIHEAHASTNLRNDNPIKTIDTVQSKNPVIQSVFESKIRTNASSGRRIFGNENRITNGLSLLIEALSPYINWIIFFGMSGSVILIIYNGFIIVTNPGEDKIKSAKTNITNIVIGVLILGGFSFILKVIGGLLTKLIGG